MLRLLQQARVLWSCVFLSGLINTTNSRATEFYVSPDGMDTNPGTLAMPWQTLTKVSQAAAGGAIKPGDSILLAGGATFEGTIYLNGASASGTLDAPICIGSFGEGRATIVAAYAIYIYNAGGHRIRDLNLLGNADKGGNGVMWYTDASDGRRLAPIAIERCTISGFAGDGICIGSWHESYPGWDGIRITEITSSDNGKAGIFTYDLAGVTHTAYAHRNVSVQDCVALRNGSGSGIVLAGVDGGLVDRCRASDNVSPVGAQPAGFGIWLYSCRAVTIQRCIATGQRTAQADGGGFDLDGGTEDCVIQWCYSADNDGHGFMHCDYPGSRPTRRNIIRWSISEFDARESNADPAGLAFVSWGEGIEDCHIHNCVVATRGKSANAAYGLASYIVTNYGGKSPQLNQCTFRNNIVWVIGDSGTNVAHVWNQQSGVANVVYQGNRYHAVSGAPWRWVDGGTQFSTLEAWRSSKGQERLLGRDVGSTGDPGLTAPGTVGANGEMLRLSALSAYTLKDDSPCAVGGVDLTMLFGGTVGNQDLFGNKVQTGQQWPVGAHKPQ